MMNRKCQKKGFVQIQFAWIFIVIAGSMILLFFIGLVKTQQDVSENKLAAKVLTNLDAIITGSKVSTNTCHLIDIPKLDIELNCRVIMMGKNERGLDAQTVFGPDRIKGNKLITCSKDWNTPFRILNFLYLTTTEVRYIIIYTNTTGNDDGERLYDNLPDSLNKQLLPKDKLSLLKDKNNYKIKIICLNDECNIGEINNHVFLVDYDTTLINILESASSPDSEYSHGDIEFYKKDSTGELVLNDTTHFLRDASLYGAIFSEDVVQYECVMAKAYKRLALVSELYLNRTDMLKTHFEGSSNTCKNYYGIIPTDLIRDIKDKSLIGLSGGSVDVIDNSAIGLKSQNELAQLYSCPVIY